MQFLHIQGQSMELFILSTSGSAMILASLLVENREYERWNEHVLWESQQAWVIK